MTLQQQEQPQRDTNKPIATDVLIEQLKAKRQQLEQQKADALHRIKAINAELAALPKLPTKRGPRKAKNGAAVSGKGE